ncbi:unnamed protein product [Heterobilharzia americana]|nr:unnamed protein product [Heterobilharzia americana]
MLPVCRWYVNSTKIGIFQRVFGPYKFSSECNRGEVAVLHCKIKRTQDGSLEPGVVYRKPTHSNGYLDFMSSHPISVRVGLVKW